MKTLKLVSAVCLAILLAAPTSVRAQNFRSPYGASRTSAGPSRSFLGLPIPQQWTGNRPDMTNQYSGSEAYRNNSNYGQNSAFGANGQYTSGQCATGNCPTRNIHNGARCDWQSYKCRICIRNLPRLQLSEWCLCEWSVCQRPVCHMCQRRMCRLHQRAVCQRPVCEWKLPGRTMPGESEFKCPLQLRSGLRSRGSLVATDNPVEFCRSISSGGIPE